MKVIISLICIFAAWGCSSSIQILPQKKTTIEWDLSTGKKVVDKFVDKIWAESYIAEQEDINVGLVCNHRNVH